MNPISGITHKGMLPERNPRWLLFNETRIGTALNHKL